MITIAEFHNLLAAYMRACHDHLWVQRNLDHFKLQKPGDSYVAWQASLDRERAALREVIEAARGMCDDWAKIDMNQHP